MKNDIVVARAKKIAEENHTPQKLVEELGFEFGRRLSEAVKSGIPMDAALEMLKINFRKTGEMMILIADSVTVEMKEPPKAGA